MPESELPVLHPHLEDFRPDDSGISPLERATDWYETACPKCGGPAHRETDVTDNFLCSGWYFLRYPSALRDDTALDPELTRKWLPVDSYIGGNEHAVLHLMYARFLTMALHDLGVLDFEEPFDRFRAHGLLISDGRKMSKSKGNVVLPDEIVARFGADTMRLYLLFLGPYEHGGDWQGQGHPGPVRLPQPPLAERRRRRGGGAGPGGRPGAAPDGPPGHGAGPGAAVQHRHRGDDGVPERGTRRRAYAAAVGTRTAPGHARAVRPARRRGAVRPVSATTRASSRARRGPAWDEGKLVEETVEIAVQVNGRLRGRISMAVGADEAAVIAAATENENVARHLADKTLRKTIVVPDKLVNLVVG